MRNLLKIQLATICIFAFVKSMRPILLEKGIPEWGKTFMFSFPNFCEAIVGVITLTMLGLFAQQRLAWMSTLKGIHLYLIATFLTGIYVITQELKIHNLGGENVYDPNDVLFSVVGLFFGLMLVLWLSSTKHLDNSV